MASWATFPGMNGGEYDPATAHGPHVGALKTRTSPSAVFVQPGYHRAAPFSTFLPGIAGLYGKPLWCYIVNRGQGVACFGTCDKNHGILPFQSANPHYARVEQEGFRTLLRWRAADGGWRGVEPFRGEIDRPRAFSLSPSALGVEESDPVSGFQVRVEVTTVPGEDCAALLRSMTLRNDTEETRAVEVVDGLPGLVPYGMDHYSSQNAPFSCQGYVRIDGLAGRLPFLRFLDAPSYLSEIPERPAGNFYFAFLEGGGELLPVLVDRDLLFGEGRGLAVPVPFFEGTPLDLGGQKTACLSAAAFAVLRRTLAPGESVTVHSLCGMAESFERARAFADRAQRPGWVADKRAESAREVEKIRHHFFFHSGVDTLNEYLPQTFLDNVLRGGLPMTLRAGNKTHALHVFNRVHGDLERDYNQFRLEPTAYSQGNGHYRDVNQNRRNDVWFHPALGTANLRYFFNLLRLDGYNPMNCLGVAFHLDDPGRAEDLAASCPSGQGWDGLVRLLSGEFTPGELYGALEAAGVPPEVRESRLEEILAESTSRERASFGTGFWIDHWFYCLDQLDRTLALFPDRLRTVLFDDRVYTYWDDEHRLRPRAERMRRTASGKVQQEGGTDVDPRKQKMLALRGADRNQARTDGGHGPVYRTNLLEKLLCLMLNKAATLAPSGMGIEMEAGHPGWHDSINRLPYLFGSSTSELFQLLRMLRRVRDLLASVDLPEQTWPRELETFRRGLAAAVREDGEDAHAYWEAANRVKEAFREETWMGLSGDTCTVPPAALRAFLDQLEAFLSRAAERVNDPGSGLPVTYYLHRPVEWTPRADDPSRVTVTRFEAVPLPLFLEAPVHALRLMRTPSEAGRLCEALRASPLFDPNLRMYLLGDSLAGIEENVGRITMWTPGWFENENVFLHMEHKLLVAMFESGQVERLFETLREVMVPFQPVERYGRSPLENTSFIVSSRHPAPERHGRGYLPRSSGTTAEVLDLFLRLGLGETPFRMEEGGLVFCPRPVLPPWMFSEQDQTRILVHPDGTEESIWLPAGSFAMRLLGHTLLVYLNPERRPTWGENRVSVREIRLHDAAGGCRTLSGDRLTGPDAPQLRDGLFARIELRLG